VPGQLYKSGIVQDMTADETLALIRVKVERAKEHIRVLETEVGAFLAAKPYAIETKRDPQTRRLIYFIASVRETPIRIAAIVGDVIQNLRSSLDHLAYQLVWIGTGQVPFSHVYFPIAEDASTYPAKRDRQVKGAGPQAIAEIDAVAPYKGGDDMLWRLHKLNNVDKHRILITVGSAYHSVNLTAHIFRHLPLHWNLPAMPVPNGFFKVADPLFPLKQGAELFIDAPDAKVDDQLQFHLDVAFGEPQILDGEPLIATLHQMADHVDAILLKFKPWLA
jgi:hypothetical protein